MKKVLLYIAGTLALVLSLGIGGCGVKRALKQDMNAEVRAELAGQAKAVQLADGVISYGWQGPQDGPVVVLVHGFSVPRFVFDLNVKALAGAGFRVLTYDHFGRGYSDRPDTTYDADFYERELDGLLNALNVKEPIYLVGYSMGGGVAAVFAGRHPERIKKLALIAPIGFLPPPEGRAAIGGIPLLGDVLMTLTGESTLLSRMQASVDAGHAPAYFLDGYKKQMEYGGYIPALLSSMRNFLWTDLSAEYQSIARHKIPALLIWGTDDKVVPYAGHERVQAILPDVRFISVADTGHAVAHSRPELVNRNLIDFFKD